MPYGLDLPVLSEIEKTVEARAGGDASGIRMRGSEFAELVAFDFFYFIRVGIVYLFRSPEKPVHAVADARSEVYVLEQGEIRQTDAETVGHSVLELVQKSRLVEFGCLEIYLVLQRGVVAERKFFIKSFFH